MAVISTIRNKFGTLVVVVIAISILGFLLMDVINSDTSVLQGDVTSVGIVNGNEITYDQYNQRFLILEDRYKQGSGQLSVDEQTSFLLRDQAWDEAVNEILLNEQYEALGIKISAEEFQDMVLGPNPDPRVQQEFTDPTTGVFRKEVLSNWISAIKADPERAQERAQWSFFANALRRERTEDKYEIMIKKGMYIPTWMAEEDFLAKNRRANIKYIKVPLTSISDTVVEVSESDMSKYLSENAGKYKQEATRAIDFVAFDVKPSLPDSTDVYEWIVDMQTKLFETEDDSAFISLQSSQPFDRNYYARADITGTIGDTLFSMEVGSVYGPFLEEGAYRVAKLVDKKTVPDSVRYRQIFLAVNTREELLSKQTLMDSLTNVIKEGEATFEDVLQAHTNDEAAKDNGGDMGWVMRGEEFETINYMLFFGGKQGGVYSVPGQAGFHIIEILEAEATTEAVQIGYLIRPIEASKKTRDLIYNRAVAFAGKNRTPEQFESAIDENDLLIKRTAPEMKISDYNVLGLGMARDVVRWAFEAEEGDVSEEVFVLENSFVIGHLTNVKEEGTASLDDVRTEIETSVIKEKKTRMIVDQIKEANASDLDGMATALDQQVESATFITFSSTFIPGIGNEPKVVGAIFGLGEGNAPYIVEGNSGVYVIQVESFEEPGEAGDLSIYVSQLAQPVEANIEKELINALKKAAELEDRRHKFF